MDLLGLMAFIGLCSFMAFIGLSLLLLCNMHTQKYTGSTQRLPKGWAWGLDVIQRLTMNPGLIAKLNDVYRSKEVISYGQVDLERALASEMVIRIRRDNKGRYRERELCSQLGVPHATLNDAVDAMAENIVRSIRYQMRILNHQDGLFENAGELKPCLDKSKPLAYSCIGRYEHLLNFLAGEDKYSFKIILEA